VRDTGIGISEDRLDAIFEAFQQAEAGTARKYGGTGLGLAISRSICLLMGYDLIVDSQLGKGSTFTIVMGERPKRQPRAQESRPKTAPAPDEPAQAPAVEPTPEDDLAVPGPTYTQRMRDFKVLVIDDEEDSRDLMSHYLEDFGCQVLTANGGEEGMALARGEVREQLQVHQQRLKEENDQVWEEGKGRFATQNLIGNSPPMQALVRLIDQIRDRSVDDRLRARS